MSTASILFKSSRDGSTLELGEFAPEYTDSDSKSFVVKVNTRGWSIEQRASAYLASDLGVYFTDLAAHWKGWKGEKRWTTLEREFELSASTDLLGHITLAFSLNQGFSGGGWKLQGEIELEAGALEALAAQAREVWAANAA
jgi:hypothetical protein